MYKIFNPKTKRYINSGSNLGKSILQNSYNINKSNNNSVYSDQLVRLIPTTPSRFVDNSDYSD